MHRFSIGSQHIFSQLPKAVTRVENNPHLAVKEQIAVQEQSAAVLQNFKHNFIDAERGLETNDRDSLHHLIYHK